MNLSLLMDPISLYLSSKGRPQLLSELWQAIQLKTNLLTTGLFRSIFGAEGLRNIALGFEEYEDGSLSIIPQADQRIYHCLIQKCKEKLTEIL